MWDCLGALHCGHAVSPTAVAFQLARRERVLERDIFRFGTATSVLIFRLVGGRRARKRGQGRPPGVDHVVVVARIVGEVCTALRAQPRTVRVTHRLEWQSKHHCVTRNSSSASSSPTLRW